MSERGKSYQIPRQDRALLCDPPWPLWPVTVAAGQVTSARSQEQTLGPAGLPFALFRRRCRATVRRLARDYTRRLDQGSAARAGTPAHLSDEAGPPRAGGAGGSGGRARPGPQQEDDLPFLVTGHQPIFSHPGIWAKDALVAAAARRWPEWTGRGAYALHLVVDSDYAEQPAPLIPLPSVPSGLHPPRQSPATPCGSACCPAVVTTGRPSSYRPPWAGLSRGVWEQLPIPTWEAMDRWLEAVADAVERLDAPVVLATWQRNLAYLAAAWQPRGTLALWTSRSRRLWEQQADPSFAGLEELPVSWLARTRWFIWYVLDLALRAQSFQQAYNAALTAYRQAHQILRAGEPFPPLHQADSWWELPFWVQPAAASPAGAGARQTLWVELSQQGLRVAAGDRDGPAPDAGMLCFPYPSAPGGWAAWRQQVWRCWQRSGWQVRPKALTLTLFVRRYVADLFVHGVGGGQYDQVTEAAAASMGGGRLAPLAVVSFTRHLPIPHRSDAQERYQQLCQLRRELRWNPQRHPELLELAEPQQGQQIQEWVARRQQLVRELAAARTHRARRQLHRQLASLTWQMSVAWQRAAQACGQELARVVAERHRLAAASEREYPFFLHDARQLYSEILQAATTGTDAPPDVAWPCPLAGDQRARGEGREGIAAKTPETRREEEDVHGGCNQSGRSTVSAGSGRYRDLRGFRFLPLSRRCAGALGGDPLRPAE